MKNLLKSTNLPAVTAALGGIALVLRRMLYVFAVDEKNLLTVNHPLELVLGVVSVAALAYILLAVRKLDGSEVYEDNFSADKPAVVGHMAAAGGILVTMLTNAPRMSGYLGDIWQVLGFVSPVCLLLAGLARGRGKQPFFLFHLIPCLFLMMHIVNHYQLWSGNPQFQDYGFTLFGAMALMFFAFYSAAFDVGSGNRRMQLGMGLAAVYLLMAELAQSQYPWLFLGGILWALTDLCSLTPVPKSESAPDAEAKEEA